MSTTRKIEGFVEKRAVTWFDNGESFLTLRRDKYHHGEKIPIADATLIIGGKGYTHDEVVALLVEVRSDYILEDDKEWLTECAAKHGIKLP